LGDTYELRILETEEMPHGNGISPKGLQKIIEPPNLQELGIRAAKIGISMAKIGI